MKKKDMNYFQAMKKYKLKPFGDVDKDGIKNIWDCKPFDPKRDGLFGRVVNVVSGGRYGQSREEYEQERAGRQEHVHVVRDDSGRVVEMQRTSPYRSEPQELTREEQVEPKRVHPWRTERGKQFIAGIKQGVKRVDRAVVKYNRRHNPHRGSGNYNPFGATFDTGMRPMKKPKSSKSSKKYAVVGGKAYPIAGTTKKKKKKTRSKRHDAFSFDFGSWG